MEQIIVKLRQEQMAMQEEVFRHPPADYNEFCKVLGKWCGISHSIDTVEEVINGRRNREDD